jgi:general stress protein CsbA
MLQEVNVLIFSCMLIIIFSVIQYEKLQLPPFAVTVTVAHVLNMKKVL